MFFSLSMKAYIPIRDELLTIIYRFSGLLGHIDANVTQMNNSIEHTYVANKNT